MSRFSKNFLIAALFLTVLVGRKLAPAAEWPDMRVYGPFVCRADFPLERQHHLLSQLGELQDELVQTLGIVSTRQAIEVYLFHDEESYRRYLRQIYPTLPFRRAFYVKEHGLGRVFAYESRHFEADLRHECTHALLHAVLPVVPLWLDEGLATYFEIPAEKQANQSPHFSSVVWHARFGITPSLERLEKIVEGTAMGKTEYRDAWAWVHFMCHGPTAAQEELASYLQDLAAQKPPGLLSERLSRCIPSLSAEFRISIKRAVNSDTAVN